MHLDLHGWQKFALLKYKQACMYVHRIRMPHWYKKKSSNEKPVEFHRNTNELFPLVKYSSGKNSAPGISLVNILNLKYQCIIFTCHSPVVKILSTTGIPVDTLQHHCQWNISTDFHCTKFCPYFSGLTCIAV